VIVLRFEADGEAALHASAEDGFRKMFRQAAAFATAVQKFIRRLPKHLV
jgi:hypothetical protein